MNNNTNLRFRIAFTLFVTLLIWVKLIWDYQHSGVPSAHLLHNPNLPKISNWWGGLILPVFVYILLLFISKRTINSLHKQGIQSIGIGFLCALLFGIVLSYFFKVGTEIPNYMMLAAILLSVFIPLYRLEYYLGFVLGMTYVFGAVLPIIVGGVLCLLYLFNYKIIGGGVQYLRKLL